MTDQKGLRRDIAALEGLQKIRVKRIAEIRRQQDELVEKKQREIDNLKAQLTIGVVE